MMTFMNRLRGGIAVVAFAAVMTLGICPVFAEAQDYRFELAQTEIKSGNDREIAVRLIHVPSGKPITNAVLFQTKLDMSPMGMADMTAKSTPAKADGAGLYSFRASLGMVGDWALHLAAKVPGETETIRGSLRFKALK